MFKKESNIVDGLIYHYSNYVKAMKSLYPLTKETYSDKSKTEENRMMYNSMRHEIIAYLNRLGQFYYFAKKLKNVELYEIMPTIIKFIPLRMKGTAHRAIDAPRKDDVEEYSIQIDELMHGGTKIYSNGRFMLQLMLNNGKLLHFDIIEEHEKIITEALRILKLVEEHTKQQ